MKHDYDFSLDVPYPKEAIDPLGELIFYHGTKVWEHPGILRPEVEDEAAIMTTLFGVARLAEVNSRVAWQEFCRKEELSEDENPKAYIDVLKLLEKYFDHEPLHWLLKNTLTVADGMLHGNFYQAYVQAKKAYDRGDLGLTQDRFITQRIVLVTLSDRSLTMDSQTGIVTTDEGEEYPHKSFVPSKEKTIEDNFVSFYVSAAFVSVFDVLLNGFNRSFHFRKCITNAEPISVNT